MTALPEIDDDGAVGQRFAQIKMRDEEIDKGLTEVGEGVEVLKQMALEMNDAADVTGVMLDEVENRVDDNLGRVNNLNKRLKSTLESVNSGNRFITGEKDLIVLLLLLKLIDSLGLCVEFICLMILLALVGVGYRAISGLL